VIRPAGPGVNWEEGHQARTVAMNVGGRYVTLAVELLLGVVMLPLNTRHLGQSDYGLWMLAASIMAYFPVFELGYAAAMERFVAHYRTQRDAAAINELASTLVFVFAAFGLTAFTVVAVGAWHLDSWFNLTPTQARTGGIVLLLVAGQFALGLPFAIFGAVVNGFQRTILNSVVGTVVAVAVAGVNVTVVMSGGGLVTLVGLMTATRMLGYVAYRQNAYRVFPMLQIRPSLFRRARLREVTGFSAYMLIQDVSNRMNYATDPMVIAAFLSTGAVAIWSVAQRLADVVLQLTNQLNDVLFPIVVDCDSGQRDDRLRDVLVQGTRLSLATTLPLAGALALLAKPVIFAWTGPAFSSAVVIVQILALTVLVRVGSATAGIVLRGGGRHRLLAVSNLVAALANIGLSIVLIRTHGLPGVAFATLLVVTVRAVAVLIPVACYRAGLSLGRFVATAVWPAAWPALLVLGSFAFVRDSAGGSLLRVLANGGAVCLLYAIVFISVAIGRQDRNRYLGKLRSIAGLPALETA
jgi:O-antigen/teichoic acid export membrane protein